MTHQIVNHQNLTSELIILSNGRTNGKFINQSYINNSLQTCVINGTAEPSKHNTTPYLPRSLADYTLIKGIMYRHTHKNILTWNLPLVNNFENQ